LLHNLTAKLIRGENFAKSYNSGDYPSGALFTNKDEDGWVLAIEDLPETGFTSIYYM
jgi:hypothetical protein